MTNITIEDLMVAARGLTVHHAIALADYAAQGKHLTFQGYTSKRELAESVMREGCDNSYKWLAERCLRGLKSVYSVRQWARNNLTSDERFALDKLGARSCSVCGEIKCGAEADQVETVGRCWTCMEREA